MSLPFVVAAGSTPANPLFESVEFNAANGITYRTGTVKDALDNIVDGDLSINDISISYSFPTYALMRDSAISFPDGKVLTTTEYSEGLGGGASYTKISGVSKPFSSIKS